MPRPRKKSSQSTGSTGSTGSAGAESKITSGQAAYVLDRLISERRVTRTDVNRYVAEMGREISELERRLTALREAHGGTIAAVAAATVAAGAAAVAVARRRGRPAGRRSGTSTGRPPGRPPGSGRKAGRPSGSATSSTAASASSGGDSASAGTTGGAKRGRKATTAITAGQLASRQLQGRYLALVRQFPETRRAQYARTAKEKGREAAIRDMQEALRK